MRLFNNDAMTQIHKTFADQFEADGTNYFYRKSSKGPPIRISATERDDFIAIFSKQIKYLMWGSVAIVVVCCMAAVFILPDQNPDSQGYFTWILVLAFVPLFMLAYLWLWYGPSLTLKDRPFVGEARSSAEVRQRMLANMSYGQIFSMAVVGWVLPLSKMNWQQPLLSNVNLFWGGIIAALTGACAWLVYLKWRAGSDANNPPAKT